MRYLDEDATQDDGYDIASSVMIGPFSTPVLDEVMLMDLQPLMGETSGNVNASIHIGSSAEKALAAAATKSWVVEPGRNLTHDIRRAAHSSYIKVEATNPWAMESFRLRLHTLGTTRGRGV